MINLKNLTHSQVTNLKLGKINNHDATLIIMAAVPGGLAKTGQVVRELREWRQEKRAFVYLFNTSGSSGYGFVGKNVDSVSNTVYRTCILKKGKLVNGSVTQRRTYWYRVKNGTYALTLQGFLRLSELQDQL